MYAASFLHCSVLHAKLFVRWRPGIRKMALRPRGKMFQRVNKILPLAHHCCRLWDRSMGYTYRHVLS